MADVFWLGKAQATPQVDTIVIGSHTAAQTFTYTINGKTVTYIAVAGDTTNDLVATNFAALLGASNEGEFSELDFEASAATILVTGPDDGAPFTGTTGGTGTISTSTTTSPISPHDAAKTTNYSGGALPTTGDRLVLQGTDVALKYGLGSLTDAITFARYKSYTGSIGLPDISPNGYREYRTTHLALNATAVYVEQSTSDSAGQFRLNCNSASAVTVSVLGDGAGQQLGNEVLEVKGGVANSILNVTGGSVAVAPLAGQTSIFTTIRGTNATITLGPGVTLSSGSTPTISLTGCTAVINTTYTSLSMNGGQVTTLGATAGTTTTVDGGTLIWKSTGSFGTPEVGGGGILDLSFAPASVAAGGTIKVNAGGTLLDPNGRIGTSYNIQLYRCDVNEVQLLIGPGKTLAVS